MKQVARTLAAVLAVIGVAATAGAERPGDRTEYPGDGNKEGKAEIKAQTKCPVMGGRINKGLYVDHDGKRVYVCCRGCIGAVNKEPQKYVDKLQSEGVVLDRAAGTDKK